MQKAGLQSGHGRNLGSAAIDEIEIQLDDDQHWLYALGYPDIDSLLPSV